MGDPAETCNGYPDYVPTSSPDHLLPEDLAVTLLMSSYAGAGAFLTIWQRGPEAHGLLSVLSKATGFEKSTSSLRQQVLDLVSDVGSWDHLKVAVATKLLPRSAPHSFLSWTTRRSLARTCRLNGTLRQSRRGRTRSADETRFGSRRPWKPFIETSPVPRTKQFGGPWNGSRGASTANDQVG